MILALHHVQLAMPRGAEVRARAFYTGVLGFEETEKPEILKGRGGLWFVAAGAALHLGVEEPFVPARKAHPAFRVASLEAAKRRLVGRGIAFRDGEDLPGIRRIYLDDPFGNRIELLEPI